MNGKRGAPKGARPWPTQAARVADDLAVVLADVGAKARSLDRQGAAIDRLAALGVEAVREGNYLLAVQLFQDVRTATATIRHTAATVLGTAGAASAALAKARVGEYGE